MRKRQTTSLPPCVLHEDEHLLVVNKPAGWNTHAPSPYAGEGIYDWLKHREPRWENLAILHRLDKETSGVLVFGKTTVANRSLTEQFEARTVQKKYVLLTDRHPKNLPLSVSSHLTRMGDKYGSSPRGEKAETRFELLESNVVIRDTFQMVSRIQACPLTGRTHQIRVHAAEQGFPIVGDILYGGSAFSRVCLHASEISFTHPANGARVVFTAPIDFMDNAGLAGRKAIFDAEMTTAFRLIHGGSDGWPGWYVDRFDDHLLSQSEEPLTDSQLQALQKVLGAGTLSVYHKLLTRQVRKTTTAHACPQLITGNPAPPRFVISENGIRFEARFGEGYSVGLFLDQRDNRRRLLTRHVAAGFELFPADPNRTEPWAVLNTFAYTCGFSVCAALSGAQVTSLDLSRKYLEWGRRNFAMNNLDPEAHDFIYGDTFDWLRRFKRRGRAFDLILLDPPTFSQSKASGVFRAHKDYGKLVTEALPALRRGGVLFAATNAADFLPEEFLAQIANAVRTGGRRLMAQHYVPQPPDFPVSRGEPAYLKTVWLRLD